MSDVNALSTMLIDRNACAQARDWARVYDDPAIAWDACPRVDWLLWAVKVLDLSDAVKDRVFMCRVIRETPLYDGRTVWDLLIDERSRKAVEAAERFARGEATSEELAACERQAVDATTSAVVGRSDGLHAALAAEAAAGASNVSEKVNAAVAEEVVRGVSKAVRFGVYIAGFGDAVYDAASAAADKKMVDVLREVFGNPFR